jgi:hypothetical protein
VLNNSDPATAVLALSLRVKVELVTVEACTASLKVAVIDDDTETPVAPLAGLVLVTVGGVVSAVDDELLAIYSNGSAIPSRSPEK